MKNIFLIAVLIIFLSSCEKQLNKKKNIIKIPKFKVEKIIVFNQRENSLIYFKTHITNENDKSVVFLDNSLKKHSTINTDLIKNGFYLKNIKNDSIISLGIDNYYFYEIGAKKSNYCFIGAVNLKNSFVEKDSLLLRQMITNYLLEYNGKNLNLNEIKKTIYINQKAYNEFTKRKNEVIPFIDSLSIVIPKNIKIKYMNNMPITSEEWDNL